ncbi:hypothetical protein [Rhizobium sp. LjRoot258]|uniref:hypothetical protein n=1 Tax=Rhizobium sp. LjRoot258 TaxID=3342299 RepID=UPI003ED0F36F
MDENGKDAKHIDPEALLIADEHNAYDDLTNLVALNREFRRRLGALLVISAGLLDRVSSVPPRDGRISRSRARSALSRPGPCHSARKRPRRPAL